jgi:DNA (cytosine-5)-methyltransferase 1
MDKSTFTSYHQLNKKDGNRRIWLEGEPLLRAGFMPGDFFDVVLNMNTLVVTLRHIPDSPEARARHKRKEIRKVSRRSMGSWIKPIVDICNSDITALFGEFARFRAQAFAGRIEFGIHPEDLARAEREHRLMRHLREGKITKGDAFLGLGISSHANKQGYANEGVRTEQLWAVEMEARYLDVAAKNDPEAYAQAHLFCAKVEEVEKHLLEPVDSFSFSMPCTNHSRQGKAKKGLEFAEMGDEVTALFGVVEMIKAANPALIISENVPDAMDSVTYLLLKKELNRLGYVCHDMILGQSHSGALDRRQRYWMVAYSRGLTVNPDNLTPGEEPAIHRSFGDIMERDESKHEWHALSKLLERDRVNRENGRNFKINLIDADSVQINTIPRNYTKHQVSNPHVVNQKGDAYRMVTPTEHADMKRSPRQLIGHCSPTTAHEGLGQGIAYLHGVKVAQHLIRSVSMRPGQPRLAL